MNFELHPQGGANKKVPVFFLTDSAAYKNISYFFTKIMKIIQPGPWDKRTKPKP